MGGDAFMMTSVVHYFLLEAYALRGITSYV